MTEPFVVSIRCDLDGMVRRLVETAAERGWDPDRDQDAIEREAMRIASEFVEVVDRRPPT